MSSRKRREDVCREDTPDGDANSNYDSPGPPGTSSDDYAKLSNCKSIPLPNEGNPKKLTSFSIQKKKISFQSSFESTPSGAVSEPAKVIVGTKPGKSIKVLKVVHDVEVPDKKKPKKNKKESVYAQRIKRLEDLKKLEVKERRMYADKIVFALKTLNLPPLENLRPLMIYEMDMLVNQPFNADTSKLVETLRSDCTAKNIPLPKVDISRIKFQEPNKLPNTVGKSTQENPPEPRISIISDLYSPEASPNSNFPNDSNETKKAQDAPDHMAVIHLKNYYSTSEKSKISSQSSTKNVDKPVVQNVSQAVNVDKFGFLIRDTTGMSVANDTKEKNTRKSSDRHKSSSHGKHSNKHDRKHGRRHSDRHNRSHSREKRPNSTDHQAKPYYRSSESRHKNRHEEYSQDKHHRNDQNIGKNYEGDTKKEELTKNQSKVEVGDSKDIQLDKNTTHDSQGDQYKNSQTVKQINHDFLDDEDRNVQLSKPVYPTFQSDRDGNSQLGKPINPNSQAGGDINAQLAKPIYPTFQSDRDGNIQLSKPINPNSQAGGDINAQLAKPIYPTFQSDRDGNIQLGKSINPNTQSDEYKNIQLGKSINPNHRVNEDKSMQLGKSINPYSQADGDKKIQLGKSINPNRVNEDKSMQLGKSINPYSQADGDKKNQLGKMINLNSQVNEDKSIQLGKSINPYSQADGDKKNQLGKMINLNSQVNEDKSIQLGKSINPYSQADGDKKNQLGKMINLNSQVNEDKSIQLGKSINPYSQADGDKKIQLGKSINPNRVNEDKSMQLGKSINPYSQADGDKKNQLGKMINLNSQVNEDKSIQLGKSINPYSQADGDKKNQLGKMINLNSQVNEDKSIQLGKSINPYSQADGDKKNQLGKMINLNSQVNEDKSIQLGKSINPYYQADGDKKIQLSKSINPNSQAGGGSNVQLSKQNDLNSEDGKDKVIVAKILSSDWENSLSSDGFTELDSYWEKSPIPNNCSLNKSLIFEKTIIGEFWNEPSSTVRKSEDIPNINNTDSKDAHDDENGVQKEPELPLRFYHSTKQCYKQTKFSPFLWFCENTFRCQCKESVNRFNELCSVSNESMDDLSSKLVEKSIQQDSNEKGRHASNFQIGFESESNWEKDDDSIHSQEVQEPEKMVCSSNGGAKPHFKINGQNVDTTESLKRDHSMSPDEVVSKPRSISPNAAKSNLKDNSLSMEYEKFMNAVSTNINLSKEKKNDLPVKVKDSKTEKCLINSPVKDADFKEDYPNISPHASGAVVKKAGNKAHQKKINESKEKSNRKQTTDTNSSSKKKKHGSSNHQKKKNIKKRKKRSTSTSSSSSSESSSSDSSSESSSGSSSSSASTSSSSTSSSDSDEKTHRKKVIRKGKRVLVVMSKSKYKKHLKENQLRKNKKIILLGNGKEDGVMNINNQEIIQQVKIKKKLRKGKNKKSKRRAKNKKGKSKAKRHGKKKRQKFETSSSETSSTTTDSTTDETTSGDDKKTVASKQRSIKIKTEPGSKDENKECSDKKNVPSDTVIKNKRQLSPNVDEEKKADEQFTPRTKTNLHEIISVNELHDDFVQSNFNTLESGVSDKIISEDLRIVKQEKSKVYVQRDEREHDSKALWKAEDTSFLPALIASSPDKITSISDVQNKNLSGLASCTLKNTIPLNEPINNSGMNNSDVSKTPSKSGKRTYCVDADLDKEIASKDLFPDTGGDELNKRNVMNCGSSGVVDSSPKRLKIAHASSPSNVTEEEVGHKIDMKAFDKLKKDFEEFRLQKIKGGDLEQQAAADEVKRQFDLMENHSLPGNSEHDQSKVESPMSDIRPIPTVTGISANAIVNNEETDICLIPIVTGVSANVITSNEEITNDRLATKWDWMPYDHTSHNIASSTTNPSRRGAIGQEFPRQNRALIEIPIKGDEAFDCENGSPIASIFDYKVDKATIDPQADYELNYGADIDNNAVYSIPTISSLEHGNISKTHQEFMYDMYSENQEMGYVALPGTSKRTNKRKISLDERINLVLGSEIKENEDHKELSQSPPQLPSSLDLNPVEPTQHHGILILGGIGRKVNIKKKVQFSDGLEPGMDSDVESATEPQSKKYKKQKIKKKCGGHSYPCPSYWPDYHPYYDTLPPPPPPPGSPTLTLKEPFKALKLDVVTNSPDTIMTRLPKLPNLSDGQLFF